jgi:hypothetical protein
MAPVCHVLCFGDRLSFAQKWVGGALLSMFCTHLAKLWYTCAHLQSRHDVLQVRPPSEMDTAAQVHLVWHPLKQATQAAEIHITRKSGGRWRFAVQFTSCQPEVDGTVVCEAHIGQTVTCPVPCFAPGTCLPHCSRYGLALPNDVTSTAEWLAILIDAHAISCCFAMCRQSALRVHVCAD